MDPAHGVDTVFESDIHMEGPDYPLVFIGKMKIFDSQGNQLFDSNPNNQSITNTYDPSGIMSGDIVNVVRADNYSVSQLIPGYTGTGYIVMYGINSPSIKWWADTFVVDTGNRSTIYIPTVPLESSDIGPDGQPIALTHGCISAPEATTALRCISL